MQKKRIDLTGKKIGNWEVLYFSSRNPETRQSKWMCRCVCGVEKEVLQGGLQLGTSKSCGCSKARGESNGNYKHGLAHKTKVYSSWSHIKSRCYNPDNIDYPTYGAVGIKMEEDWRYDFLSFYSEIGEPPENNQSWGVERIDTTKGYTKGNIKWAKQDEQAKNRVRPSNNTSGVMGVGWKHQGDYTAAYAQWTDHNGKKRTVSFNVSRYGLLPAFKMAVETRNNAIKDLILNGGYKESHGKDKYEY